MSDALRNTIAEEVRAYVKTVENLERTRYKTVLRYLENKLDIERGGLDMQKDLIKTIIKDEMIREFQERAEQVDKSNVGDDFNNPQMYFGDILEFVQSQGSESSEPKKYYSAYLFYCNEQRDKLKNSRPDLATPDLLKEIGSSWKSLSYEDKQRYVTLSEMDRIRYNKEIEDWRQKNPDIFVKSRRERDSQKRERDLTVRSIGTTRSSIPKKARSAYIFYCLKHRTRIQEENENISPVEVSRHLGREWNSLTTEEKEPYRQMESDDRLRYVQELKDLGLTPEDVRRSNRNSSASASRAKSAYLFFCMQKREEVRNQNPQLTSNDINKHLNSLWSSMSEEERFPYEECTYDDKNRIKREVEKVKMSIKDPIVLPLPKAKRVKRARTPYTLFYKEQMAQLREQNGSLPFGEISKKLADIWKSMTDDQKQVYIDRSRTEQETLPTNDDVFHETTSGFENYYNQRMQLLQQGKLQMDEHELRDFIHREWESMDENARQQFSKQSVSMPKEDDFSMYDDHGLSYSDSGIKMDNVNEGMETEQDVLGKDNLMMSGNIPTDEDRYDSPN